MKTKPCIHCGYGLERTHGNPKRISCRKHENEKCYMKRYKERYKKNYNYEKIHNRSGAGRPRG